METVTLVRIIAGALAVGVGVIVYLRRRQAAD